MKLIDILVQELPKRGGWIKGNYQCAQDKNGEVSFYTKGEILISSFGVWSIPVDSDANHDGLSRVATLLADDYSETIITLEQYEAALAASKPEWNGEGLPPVGYRVEANYGGEWVEATIAYTDRPEAHGDAVAWKEALVFDCKTTRPFWTDEFRPIRSEEDKKRAECVIALSRIDPQAMPFEYGDTHSDGSLIGPFWYELYDAIAAGKIPHIRID